MLKPALLSALLFYSIVFSQEKGSVEIPLSTWEQMVDVIEAGKQPGHIDQVYCPVERTIEGAFHRGIFRGVLTARFTVFDSGHVRIPVIDGNATLGAGSGSVKKIHGWIVKFFPYLPANEKEVRRNPFIENVMTDKTALSFSDIPCGISRTEFVWLYHEQIFEMKFLAGFTGFTQNKTSREIRPEIGWIITDVTNEPKSDK